MPPRKRLVARALGPRRLDRLEELAQRAQGKGWTSTVAQEVEAVRELLGAAADRPLVILDAGANVGDWTSQVLHALPQAYVHAFEPSSAAATRLASAVGSNERVVIHQLALGDRDGEAVLYARAPGSKISSLTKRRRAGAVVDEVSCEETVPVSTLDSWARSREIDSIDVLKLDVEGHELDVLRGGGDLLAGLRVVQFEFGGCHIDTRTYFRDFWYFLTEAGLRLHRLGPSGLGVVDQYRERDEVFVTTTYFASG